MSCFKNIDITNIDRLDGNDLSVLFTMRYRLASDPDVDASYITVTTTRNFMGVDVPYFDTEAMDEGTYVLHTYYTASGSSTGTKTTIDLSCIPDDALP